MLWKPLFRQRLLALSLTVLPLVAASTTGQQMMSLRDSRRIEREEIVNEVAFLEANPLAHKSNRYRINIRDTLREVSDIKVYICQDIFGDYRQIRGDYKKELYAQMAFSQAKYAIDNYDKPEERTRPKQYLAGVEGMLRTFQALRRDKKKIIFPLLDELMRRQTDGKLEEYVTGISQKNCG